MGGQANETDFVGYMQAMNLPHPKKIDEAVPANLRSGCPLDGQLPAEPNWADDLRVTYAGVPEIGAEWLLQYASELTLLDVRHPGEVIPGELPACFANALEIPLDQLRQRHGEVPTNHPIVTLCRSGRRSALAASILQTQGFTQVASLRGGLLSLANG